MYRWYIDMVNGRYAPLTVPFGSMASSSNVLLKSAVFHWRWTRCSLVYAWWNKCVCVFRRDPQFAFSMQPFFQNILDIFRTRNQSIKNGVPSHSRPNVIWFPIEPIPYWCKQHTFSGNSIETFNHRMNELTDEWVNGRMNKHHRKRE